MSLLLNIRYGVKIPARYLLDIPKLILKFIWKSKSSTIMKIILKKEKVGRLTLPNFKATAEL
jgi:hypothetical protein